MDPVESQVRIDDRLEWQEEEQAEETVEHRAPIQRIPFSSRK